MNVEIVGVGIGALQCSWLEHGMTVPTPSWQCHRGKLFAQPDQIPSMSRPEVAILWGGTHPVGPWKEEMPGSQGHSALGQGLAGKEMGSQWAL